MHMTQIFTDGVMLTLAALTLALMAIVAGWLVLHHDSDFGWALAYCGLQALIVYYFWIIYNSDTSPAAISIVVQIGRPATAGMWLLTVLYAVSRLRLKAWERRV